MKTSKIFLFLAITFVLVYVVAIPFLEQTTNMANKSGDATRVIIAFGVNTPFITAIVGLIVVIFRKLLVTNVE